MAEQAAASAPPADESSAGTAAAESSSAPLGAIGRRGRQASDGRRFQRELRSMMYGFGDAKQPLAQSVHLMEELVIDYVHSVLHQATVACEGRQRGARAGVARVKERDLIFALRKDPRRQQRVEDILEVWKEVKAARGSSIDDMSKEE